MNRPLSIAFHTLGCKLNFSETSFLSNNLLDAGYIRKQFTEPADIYVINTCSVTENADKECKQLINRVKKLSPESYVIIIGCYAQLKPTEISNIKGVDLVLGAAEKFNLHLHLQNLITHKADKIYPCEISEVQKFIPSYSLNDRTRAFLKVQDGCDYSCTFCTIPLARGKSRSNTIENVVKDVETLSEKGVKEIVLTGINLGDFKYDKINFYNLLKALESTSMQRFRISSIEPNLLSAEIISLVSESKKIMPHFHIPLQSGSNKVLRLMKRRYTKELYAEKVQTIKKHIPHCAIGVDVIVGFPSETEEDFLETYHFLNNLDISYLHVFTYSERENTEAITIKPPVPIAIRRKRNETLRKLSDEKLELFIQKYKNEKRNVLFEATEKGNTIEGYTDNYIRVSTAYDEKLVNQIVQWEIG